MRERGQILLGQLPTAGFRVYPGGGHVPYCLEVHADVIGNQDVAHTADPVALVLLRDVLTAASAILVALQWLRKFGRISTGMMKEIGDSLKALAEFLDSPKKAAAIFLCSAAWVTPSIRQVLPIHGVVEDYAGLIASVRLTLSGAYLAVFAVGWVHQRFDKRIHSPGRLARRALGRATPIEKFVLGIPIRLGEHRIRLDVGSPIAMHLQEVGLIKRATGLPHTEYWLATGLADLCIRRPSLLRLSPEEESGVRAQFDRWRRDGTHQRLFDQLAGPSEGSWMA